MTSYTYIEFRAKQENQPIFYRSDSVYNSAEKFYNKEVMSYEDYHFVVPLTIIASFNRDAEIPLGPSIDYGFLAQLVEQLTLNHQVEGSSPSEPTSYVSKTAEMPFF